VKETPSSLAKADVMVGDVVISGYTVNFLYGGRSKEGWGASWENVETFGGGCQQHASVTEKRTPEKGKIYGFTMTI